MPPSVLDILNDVAFTPPQLLDSRVAKRRKPCSRSSDDEHD